MGPGREASGGSAANTVAGLASLGLRAGFIGQLADDQLGEIFAHDIRSLGVEFDTPPQRGHRRHRPCLILVTPDAQRTMNTFLGAAQCWSRSGRSRWIAAAHILYLEGYLWDPAGPRAAMYKAMDAARDAGTKVAFTLSDSFVVDRHRADLFNLLEERRIDILFANEAEILQLGGIDDIERAVAQSRRRFETLIVTRGERARLRSRIRARQVRPNPSHDLSTRPEQVTCSPPVSSPVNAGARPRPSLRLGAICAAEVIQHYGARPEADLRALTEDLLD